ncbi:TrmH2 [Desulforapulum autotrophicum HRM2]|uniref:tRNA (cytidine/uridine-2'-O-)-methyltransferase TrmJ n=1 Tax=Desulforapulum autotrophicum (strain ATCC 43914 / DSM 3382 / VKM B-1955 / HRM2) TaxID=177437 RepID=C0QKR3_DESAH|nr:RNA methyltransferase [Desulforapulum autotrophicum]ACN16153.1 TrmH2 [Desulforapulum autotrophicum HRM2]
MKKQQITVVLVEPQGPLNIGSVCRAMMNFGFSQLCLVNPCTTFNNLDARKMALSALPILEKAVVVDTLAQALKNCHLAFGTTRRFGKYRQDFLSPEDFGRTLAEEPDTNQCALVMGREDHGLYTSELELCQRFVTIPTENAYGSMNLSHATALLLYQASMALGRTIPLNTGSTPPATSHELAGMYDHMTKSLCDIDFLNTQNPDHLLRTFRRIFGRAGLDRREVAIIRGLMGRIDWTESERKKHLKE